MLLFQAILLFLFPLGLYCLVLANINRRDRPLVLWGAWDAILMLAGGAGFFLVLMPTLLVYLYHRNLAGAVEADETFLTVYARWWLLWLLYYVAVVGGAVALIRWRRHKTVIYNVDTELFPAAFAQAARLAGLECRTHAEQPGDFILTAAPAAETALAVAPLPPLRHDVAVVNVEPFPAGCHVTLHWLEAAPATRLGFEQQLAKVLEAARPADNPLTGWFLVISGLVFGLIAVVVLVVYVGIYLRLH